MTELHVAKGGSRSGGRKKDNPPVFREENARLWCEQLAAVLPKRVIESHGRPYLERYYAAGWRPPLPRMPPWRGGSTPAIFLHHFVASDPSVEVHSHPWGWSASFILAGGYREERCLADGADGEIIVETYLPGDFNILEADDKHRIDLLENDCWSLFLAGKYAQPWEFFDEC